MPRPLRPECALILDGWHDEQIRRGMAWLEENLPVPRPESQPIRIPTKVSPAEWGEDPPPIITNRDPTPEGVTPPTAITSLIKLATEHGFSALAAYSLGYRRKTTIGQYRQCEAWGVYSAPGLPRFIAIYERTPGTKSWTWGSILAAGQPVTTVTLLKEWIRLRGEVDDLWYRREKKKIIAKKAVTKVREHGG